MPPETAQTPSLSTCATSMRVALREYAPDVILLPGPGETLGGVVGGIIAVDGYRGIRTRNRLKFLVMDWGVEKFRQVLEDEYLGRALPDGPAPERANGRFTGLTERLDVGETSKFTKIEDGLDQPGYVVCSYEAVPASYACRFGR